MPLKKRKPEEILGELRKAEIVLAQGYRLERCAASYRHHLCPSNFAAIGPAMSWPKSTTRKQVGGRGDFRHVCFSRLAALSRLDRHQRG